LWILYNFCFHIHIINIFLISIYTIQKKNQKPEDWYYWDDAERNNLGEDLETCAKKYGLWDSRTLPDAIIWACEKDMQMSGIYLSKERSQGNSWGLTMKRHSTKEPMLMRLYENCPTTYRKPGIFSLDQMKCLLCGKEARKKCSRCHGSYCSAQCQKSHWIVHKEICHSSTPNATDLK
jgi:hypothetical protein